ncbi:MAG: alpha,alpha-trehalose-phosphate synthase (UDP-forming) [Silvanigrellaceae bacterium]
MKLFVRFLLPLITLLGIMAYLMVPLATHFTQQWFTRDLDLRSRLLLTTLQENVAPLLASTKKLDQKKGLEILKKATQDERLMAVGFCDTDERLLLKTELFPDSINCSALRELPAHIGLIVSDPNGDIHLAYGFLEAPTSAPESHQQLEPARETLPTTTGTQAKTSSPVLGKLVFLHDMGFATRRSEKSRNYIFAIFMTIASITALTTMLFARWSQLSWLKTVRGIVGGVRASGLNFRTEQREFLPILKDLRTLVRQLESSERMEEPLNHSWSAKSIKEILKHHLSGEEVIVVSNRQPYIHNNFQGTVEVQSPASGLVTAVEPILRACSGVWIAHGNGTADKDVVDSKDRIKVPPRRPEYDIHRIWLTKEEEQGYYYGFSNEGLWPLCHNAHIRPTFRKEDWDHYVSVNEKFCDAVVQDAKTDEPVVLVQDYHFALLPRMIRKRLPKATIITFWHIPWPNAEAFGICPWRKELLHGLLGSSIIGFHTQFHCNNFFDCVDRYLEARIDKETNSISYRGKISEVRSYPISVEWPPHKLAAIPTVQQCRAEVCAINNLDPEAKIAVGIDRLDYTKGIIERFRAVEKLLESTPHMLGQFTLIQIAAPTRSTIPAYQNFESEVRRTAAEINSRFGTETYAPIILKVKHHEPEDVFRYFRAADVCLVTSIADGMNLVAKEFIATRDDESGVLILSMFAGASKEMLEALIINPYDIEQAAEALKKAITMPSSEQQIRMRAMRAIVKECNVFRWAGRMLIDASKIRRRNQFYQTLSEENFMADRLF